MTVAWRNFHGWVNRVDEKYGAEIQILTGAFLVAVAIVVVIVAIQVRDQTGAGVVSCERSKEFGPFIARDYRRRHVLPAHEMRRYERTIPTHCG